MHNTEEYVETCIRGLLSQTYPRDQFEIILVDNNSTDRSVEIARGFPGVQVLSETRRGSYAARNRGLAAANGDLIVFLDADCAPTPDWLERITDAMDATGALVVQGRRDFVGRSFGLSVLNTYESEKADLVYGMDDPTVYYAAMGNIAVRRSVLDRIGPLSEVARGGDVMFIHRVIEQYGCGAVHYAPEVCVRELDVQDTATWFKKLFTYGRSCSAYRKIAAVRPLGAADRMRVLQRTMSKTSSVWPLAAMSLPVLFVAGACYDLGRCFPLEDHPAPRSGEAGD